MRDLDIPDHPSNFSLYQFSDEGLPGAAGGRWMVFGGDGVLTLTHD